MQICRALMNCWKSSLNTQQIYSAAHASCYLLTEHKSPLLPRLRHFMKSLQMIMRKSDHLTHDPWMVYSSVYPRLQARFPQTVMEKTGIMKMSNFRLGKRSELKLCLVMIGSKIFNLLLSVKAKILIR